MNHLVCDQLARALAESALVQSFSGVRTKLGLGPDISPEHSALAQAYAFAYARRTLSGLSKGILVMGRDPRPTGEALVQALAKGFVAGASAAKCKLRIIDLGVITTPLIEMSVRALKSDGGVMVTASHNPLTDNGFKFLSGNGAANAQDASVAPPGALISAPSMSAVVDDVLDISKRKYPEFTELMAEVDDNSIRRCHGDGEDHRHRIMAERAYLDFLGAEWGVQPHCLKPLVFGPVLLDPNGGAACGIGARVLEHFGVRAIEVNAELGYPEHAIDTDGIDPASGRHMLFRVSRAALRHNARFGIAFDYDADRGNMVLAGSGEGVIIPPQTVATMNIALALTHRAAAHKRNGRPLAVVISDATSGASDKVATWFGAEVFMVETGEINVVTKMHQLRAQGYDVPIGVEGANGGSIFGTATCRDGLQTALCAALADSQESMAQQCLNILKCNHKSADTSGVLRLPEIISGVPNHFNRMLKFTGPALSHEELKSRIEYKFAQSMWPMLKSDFSGYRFANYEGVSEVKARSADATGGWRVIMGEGDDRAFMFVRGSRTEAGVWRLIVDDPNPVRGAQLVTLGTAMIESAFSGT